MKLLLRLDALLMRSAPGFCELKTVRGADTECPNGDHWGELTFICHMGIQSFAGLSVKRIWLLPSGSMA